MTAVEVEQGPVGFFSWPRVAALIVAVAVLAGAIGYVIGQPDDADLNDVDIGFMADMITHHQGAVALAFAYLPNQNDGVVTAIAQEIATKQSVEISIMNGRLLASGNRERVDAIVNDDVAMEWMNTPVDPADMPGLASVSDFEELEGSTGVDADDVFTRLMIDHHAAGVEMADFVVEHGSDKVVRRFARAMAQNQRDEIGEMNLRRVKLGLEPYESAGHHTDGDEDDGHSP